MGLRFRKSLKIAPGVKLNLNKKSTSVTFGGKGFHHTVSSTGKRTSTVGIPGTGLSYSKTSNPKNNKTNTFNNDSNLSSESPLDNNAEGKPPKKPFGCLTLLLAVIGIFLGILFFPVLWMPGIVAILWFAIRKNEPSVKKKRLLISSIITISSFLVLVFFPFGPELTGIQADWEQTTYDVSDTVKVNITPVPSDADIYDLELSDENIADLEYEDGKAILHFKKSGDIQLSFIADDDIKSDTVTITVTDKVAEKKAEEERIAAEKKAEEERIAAEKKAEEERIKAEQEAAAKAEAERIAAEQAEAERIAAEQEAARLQAEQEAAAQAEAERIAAEQEAQSQEQQQSNVGETVYWTPNGEVYHSTSSCPSLSRSKTVLSGSIAESGKSRPCKNCY